MVHEPGWCSVFKLRTLESVTLIREKVPNLLPHSSQMQDLFLLILVGGFSKETLESALGVSAENVGI